MAAITAAATAATVEAPNIAFASCIFLPDPGRGRIHDDEAVTINKCGRIVLATALLLQ